MHVKYDRALPAGFRKNQIANDRSGLERGIEMDDIGFVCGDRPSENKRKKGLCAKPAKIEPGPVPSAGTKMNELAVHTVDDARDHRRDSANVLLFVQAG
jgi:hypothetical protein